MSTNSTIVLRLRPEDVERIMKCDLNKCKVRKRKRFKMETLPSIDNINRVIKGVKLSKPYIEIYHHWDGYPTTLGKWLNKHYTKYEDVLNLLLIGSCSTIIDGVIPYAGFYWSTNDVNVPEDDKNWEKEKWDCVKPKTHNEIPEASQRFQYLAIPDPNKPNKVIWYWREDATWHNLKTGKFEKI